MAEARKKESWPRKGKVKTFGDALLEIWKSCVEMIEHCKRTDFVFDLYLVNNIKSLERRRRAAGESIRIVFIHIDQELTSAHQSNKQPSNFEKFWALMENKISLQQLFITWIPETYKGNVLVHLGDYCIDDKSSCLKIVTEFFLLFRVLNVLTMKQIIV